ncbi:TetR/AcrR family transcriptional regulator [Kribbella sp. NPDC051952]|uniref:TetR/AcrR family transcriptional regulator n=1 Tax=Kribbella sp. NPDC051952 TaxID=3154851 RepID=UPI0034141BB9
MTKRVPRAESQARTRARLLRAAAELFAAQGVNGTSVEQIAERAGYTRGAFYGNFAGKPELVAALLTERTRREYDEVRAIAEGPDPADTFRHWHRRRTAQEPDWLSLRLELLLYATREPAGVRDQLRERERFARNALAAGLERLFTEQGKTPPADLAQLALIIHALEDGLLIQRALDPDAVSAEAVLDAYLLITRAWLE